MTIVPNGSAAVESYAMATVLRKQNVQKNGTGNRHAASTRFHAHRPPAPAPEKLLYAAAETKPAMPAVVAYSTTAAE